jgi:hypothetical protein
MSKSFIFVLFFLPAIVIDHNQSVSTHILWNLRVLKSDQWNFFMSLFFYVCDFFFVYVDPEIIIRTVYANASFFPDLVFVRFSFVVLFSDYDTSAIVSKRLWINNVDQIYALSWGCISYDKKIWIVLQLMEKW